eukprot:CAMPEP_0179265014 /NCGR_PEP_ID=MMETSP0797-20121207/28685_1 /TAXON_ID=47934 /ORGANISM="Dinophysis acuminata, Strain DAEP01" /LENGTH=52 /DNA_ID=CAMNT_0020973209 /DNA_START=57 /DNA_END=215 /DNA_ORIENTATION=+
MTMLMFLPNTGLLHVLRNWLVLARRASLIAFSRPLHKLDAQCQTAAQPMRLV